MPGQLPLSLILLIALEVMLFLGWGHRVLDRMRISDTQAAILIGIMIVGSFLPAIPLAPFLSLDIGGALIPIGIAVYLITTANTQREKIRALLAALVTAAVIYATDRLLPAEPGLNGKFDIDPLYLPAIVGGIVGYLAGRSRRSAFVAGVLGVVLADAFVVVQNIFAGIPGALWNIGGGGVFDATVVAGFLAVLLAELVGESREYLQGGPKSEGRSPEMLRQLEHEEMPEAPTFGEGVQQDNQAAQGRSETKTMPLTSTLLVLLLSATIVGSSVLLSPMAGRGDEDLSGRLFQMVDGEGNLIMQTHRVITVGDGFIDEANLFYQVKRVEGQKAVADLLGPVSLVDVVETDSQTVPVFSLFELFGGKEEDNDNETKRRGLLTKPEGGQGSAVQRRSKREVTFGIYTTHNDESYVTNRGKANIKGKGDIHRVAAVLNEKIKKNGFSSIHSEAIHLPHDRGAYRRSRGTALELMQDGADMLIDVHRDAGPGESYAKKVNGEWMTQVRLVVGRQNANHGANLALAKELKAIADERYPGLIKGIFIGRGNYNQDLSSRAILIEVGTEKNALESAEKGVSFFADVLSRYAERKLQ